VARRQKYQVLGKRKEGSIQLCKTTMSQRLWLSAVLLIVLVPPRLAAKAGGAFMLPELNDFTLVDGPGISGGCDPRFVEKKVVDDGRALCLKK
jgi:hypothetical protein